MIWQAALDGNYDDLKTLVDEWNGNLTALNWENREVIYYKQKHNLYGYTPLKAACLSNCVKCIILLVNSSGVDVNLHQEKVYFTPGFFGGTALWLAARFGNVEAVEVLLSVEGIDVKKKHNKKTPLEIAIFFKKDFEFDLTSDTDYEVDHDVDYNIAAAMVEKYSKIITMLEMAESQSPPPPLQRRPSNVYIPKTLPEKLPTITISIHGHGIELPKNKLIRQNNKGEELDVRVYSAASELNVCGIHFYLDQIEKKIDDALVSALKNDDEMSSYHIIKEAIEKPSEEYRKLVAEIRIESGKFSNHKVKAKFSANKFNTWHTYVPIWDKEYHFTDETFGNWIHVLNRKNIEGHVLNEDPDKLLNLVKFDDTNTLFGQQIKACKTCYPIMLIPPTTKIILLSKIIEALGSYGFKVINIIDHTCRAVDATKYTEENIKEFYQKEQQQKINEALGGKTKRKSKTCKKIRKTKTCKKIRKTKTWKYKKTRGSPTN